MSQDDLTEIKVDIAKIVEATKTNTSNIGSLTSDIKELTKDLKESLCGKKECEALEERVSKLEGKVEIIEGVPNAILKRALMTAVAGTIMFLLYEVGISK